METPNTEAIGPDQITPEDMEKAVGWLSDLYEISGTFQSRCMADLALVGATVMVASDLTPEQFLEQVKTTWEAIEPLAVNSDVTQYREALGAEKQVSCKEAIQDPRAAWPFPTDRRKAAEQVT